MVESADAFFRLSDRTKNTYADLAVVSRSVLHRFRQLPEIREGESIMRIAVGDGRSLNAVPAHGQTFFQSDVTVYGRKNQTEVRT